MEQTLHHCDAKCDYGYIGHFVNFIEGVVWSNECKYRGTEEGMRREFEKNAAPVPLRAVRDNLIVVVLVTVFMEECYAVIAYREWMLTPVSLY